MIDFLVGLIFIPLWPMGIVFPIILTVVSFRRRKRLIAYVPIISTSIWLIARVILSWDVFRRLASDEQSSTYPLDFPLESLIIVGTFGLAFVVLLLSVLSAWVTHKVLKKFTR